MDRAELDVRLNLLFRAKESGFDFRTDDGGWIDIRYLCGTDVEGKGDEESAMIISNRSGRRCWVSWTMSRMPSTKHPTGIATILMAR